MTVNFSKDYKVDTFSRSIMKLCSKIKKKKKRKGRRRCMKEMVEGEDVEN